MYKRSNKINSNTIEPSNYVEGIDIYNSLLLRYLNDPDVTREDYLITNYQMRPDLIARDYYGDSSYEGLLMLQCPIPLEELKIGLVIRLIPKVTLDNILNLMV